jgi:hypothetical protein
MATTTSAKVQKQLNVTWKAAAIMMPGQILNLGRVSQYSRNFIRFIRFIRNVLSRIFHLPMLLDQGIMSKEDF